jgi:hypothetical protein
MTSNTGPGYQVDPPTLNSAGEAAIGIGMDVSARAGDVPPACTIPIPAAGTDTLDVASTLQTIIPLWQQHFTNVGADVQNTGNTLCANADNYSHAEATIASSFHEIRA